MNVIFGSSGHAKEVNQLVKICREDKIDFFVGVDKIGEIIDGIEIISEDRFFGMTAESINNIFLGIGSPVLRSNIYNKLKARGFDDSKFPSLVHPSSVFDVVKDKINMGIGSIIARGCILTTEVNIGNFVHVNINSTISHESDISDFVTISPGCCICGNVKIGAFSFLGAGATIIDRISVCNNVVIGAGTVVIRDIDDSGTYWGVPAKKK